MKKLILFLSLFLLIGASLGIGANNVNAYVSVRGYYKSNGTYVAPYVRSNPNGLKSDNYGYTPSQGVYNKTYGTRGTEWDTPTTITDPNYYEGKALYDSKATAPIQPTTTPIPKVSPKTSTTLPVNASIDYTGHSWECDSGYKQSGSKCIAVVLPTNASIDYTGHSWECDSGYKQSGSRCVQVILPLNASIDYTGHSWECDSGYKKSGNKCLQVVLPANASIDYTGHNWECDSGYKQSGSKCVQVILPLNASVDYTGHNWECDYGYKQYKNTCISI